MSLIWKKWIVKCSMNSDHVINNDSLFFLTINYYRHNNCLSIYILTCILYTYHKNLHEHNIEEHNNSKSSINTLVHIQCKLHISWLWSSRVHNNSHYHPKHNLVYNSCTYHSCHSMNNLVVIFYNYHHC